MFRQVPNAITASRLVLAVIFFWLLSGYQYETALSARPDSLAGEAWLLNTAFVLYLIALFTDFLDGYLARKWNVEGAFGRVVDPFVDKVLVLGSFIFFAGKNFIIPAVAPSDIPRNVQTITGVVPWMVVVILGRELLVTSLRGSSEGSGRAFGAQFSGKVKMVAQSITILAILVYVNYRGRLMQHPKIDQAMQVLRDTCIWTTILITVLSGALYVRRAIGSLFAPRGENPSPGPRKEDAGE